MSKRKAKQQQKKSYSERIVALVGKSWVSTGKIIKSVGAPPRAARRALRALVKARQLKSVKVQRERFFAAPGTKAAPPEGAAKGNGRARTRSRKAAKSKGSSGKKSKRRALARAQKRKVQEKVMRTAPAVPAKKPVKNVSTVSGKRGAPVSAPDSKDEVQAAATKTVEQSGAAEQQALLT
jgi:hypothetical protein